MEPEILLPFSTPAFSIIARRDACVIGQFPDHARLLGIISAEWNSLEQYYVLLLAKALGAQYEIVYPMAYAVIANRARLQLLHAALERLIKARTRRRELKRLLNRLTKMLDQRNKYVHGLYMHESGTSLVLLDMRDAVKPQRRQTHILQLAEMQICVDKLAKLKGDLHDFILSEPWKARPRASRAPANPKGQGRVRTRTPQAPHTPPVPSP